MTAVTTAEVRHGAATDDRARLRDLVVAEWIKLRSLRSTYVSLALLVLLYLYFAVSNSQGFNNSLTLSASMRAGFDPSAAAFDGPDWLLLALGAATLGALTIVGEYSSGLIRTTFIAVPDRVRVVAAKVVVVTAVMAALGAVIATSSFLVSQAVLDHGYGYSITHAGVPRALGASMLFVVVCGLAGMALGALIRNPTATVVAICLVFVGGPLFLKQTTSRWVSDIVNAQPAYSWFPLTTLRPQTHVVGTQPSATASWVALATWVVVSVLVTTVLVRQRDV